MAGWRKVAVKMGEKPVSMLCDKIQGKKKILVPSLNAVER